MRTGRLMLWAAVMGAATGGAADDGVLWANDAVVSNTLSAGGGAARGSGSFAQGFALATGQYSVAMGFGAMALHDRSFVWSDHTNPPVVSSQSGQFIVYATNGIYLLGGRIFGNAAGLTGLQAKAIGGLGTAALLPSGAFASAAQGRSANAAYNMSITALQSDGRVGWTGLQNASGQSLTNLQDAYAFSITQAMVQVTGERMVGLSVADPYGYGFPGAGICYGDVTNGFYGASSITRDDEWNWTIAWTESRSEPIGWIDLWSGWGWFSAGGYWVSYSVGYGDEGCPTQIDLYSGTPFDGTYRGDMYGFTREDGACSLTGDGWGSWSMNLPFPESVSLGGFGSYGYPSGWFYGGYNGWCSTIEPHYEMATWEELRPVTNAVPFEIADGRHAWAGHHDAGGFDLGNVGRLQARAVAGDGSGLSNVGLAAMDLASIDRRYLLKTGDTVIGDLEVAGRLTSGGRPVATLTYVPAQGDLSMGPYTNAPSQP